MAASPYQQALALLCACLLLAGAASGGRVDVEDMLMMDRFRAWQAKHNRSYLTDAERLRRFEVYRQNMELIEATNRRGLSYRLGETPFTDLTSEEFLATHTMPRLRAPEAAAAWHWELITTRAGPVSDGAGRRWNWNATTDLDVPESVDWRTKGAVTPIKSQGACGSCWAFATVASIEGLHKIRTGQLVSLSEQELMDCSRAPPNRGCHGGFPWVAMDWVAANGGITTELDYPYKGEQGECKPDKVRNHVVKIRGREIVDENNEAALEVAVARQPVAAAINSGSALEQHYVGGVFNGPCDSDPKNINHAVTIVGYGAEPGGLKYWIVKNQWGQEWGEKGYFRFERRVKDPRGTCGIALVPSYPVM